MVRWGAFAEAVPTLAAFARERLSRPPAYLATVRADGSPRVHPVTPVIDEGHLFVFMEPSSPKGRDLRERRRYALHNGVPDTQGSDGELWIAGEAFLVTDPALRQRAVRAATYEPADRYVLFELHVDEARGTVYGDVALPDPARWTSPSR